MNIKELITNYISSNNYSKENVDKLFLSLNLANEDFVSFVRAINELEDEGIIYITNKGFVHLASKVNIYIGKIKNVRKFEASCELKDGSIIKIYNENLKNAYLNDIVRVHVNYNGYGEVIDVINHDMWEFIATYNGKYFIVEDRNFPFDIEIQQNKVKQKLVNGHVCKLKILHYDDLTLKCNIIEIIGHKNDPGMDILKAIIESGVKYTFDNKLLKYTDEIIDKQNINEELISRKDFTNELIVTIDGLDAKDLDDAISLKINDNGNFLLGVHIADVTHFVLENSIIDKEAFTRGTSIYLADRVIPMLPHSLCNGVCSLNQDELHLTMSCIMEIDETGEVIDYEITPSYIKSKARLDYDDINNLFENKKTRLSYSKEIKEMLFMMKRLSKILSKKMIETGYIQLNVDEAKLVIDEKTNKVIDIKKRISKDAEKLIENFMILANETVASHIYYMQLPFIYRVHASIPEEKLSFLTTKLKELGINIHINQNYLTPSQIQNILTKVAGSDYEYIVNNLVLRSMSKAYYSIDNIGHFGLGSKCYTHFTSPIRRYPDLIVHRFLKKYLIENNFKDENEFLFQTAENSSVTERKAVSLERDVEDMKKAEYMSNYIGCVYEGIVTGVLDFGAFVKLDNTCEGLMKFETIPGAYEYNLSYFQKQFKIGNKVMVRVMSTNINNGEINFSYVKSIKKGVKKDAKTNNK